CLRGFLCRRSFEPLWARFPQRYLLPPQRNVFCLLILFFFRVGPITTSVGIESPDGRDISLGSDNGFMAERQLDLFEFGVTFVRQLGKASPQVVRRDGKIQARTVSLDDLEDR